MKRTVADYIKEHGERYKTSAEIRVEPDIYHIHFDSSLQIPEKFSEYLTDLGFVNSDFDFTKKHPDKPYYAAIRHMTLKVKPENVEGIKEMLVGKAILEIADDEWQRANPTQKMRIVFEAIFDKTIKEAKTNNFKGYVEGEFITNDMQLSDKAVNEEKFQEYFGDKASITSLPLQITKRKLRGEAEGEPFRKGEVHVTMDEDHSDPRVIKALEQIGLSRTVIPKDLVDNKGAPILDKHKNHVTKNDAVFTIQATNFQELKLIYNYLAVLLHEVGGTNACTMKLEYVPKFYVSPDCTVLSPASPTDIHGLPPVIEQTRFRQLPNQRLNHGDFKIESDISKFLSQRNRG